MVEVAPDIYDFAQLVLDEFDPSRSRDAKLSELEQSLQATKQKEEEVKPSESPDLSIKA